MKRCVEPDELDSELPAPTGQNCHGVAGSEAAVFAMSPSVTSGEQRIVALRVRAAAEGPGTAAAVSIVVVEKSSAAPLKVVWPSTPSPGPCNVRDTVGLPPARTLNVEAGNVTV